MLTRTNRLRKKKDFTRVFARGRTVHMPAFTLKYRPNSQLRSRAAVVISTKVAKKAVVRNRTRRRFYAQLQELWPDIQPGVDMVILLRHQATNLSGKQLHNQLRSCFQKAGILH